LRSLVADSRVVTEEEIDVAYALAQLPGAQAAFLGMLRVYCNILGIRRREVKRILAGLPRIAQPTMLLWGERDPVLPLASAYEALARLPNAKLVVLEACGHVPFVEAAPLVNQLLDGFVRQVSAGSFAATHTPQRIGVEWEAAGV
jgi:pimeloyl-ACP methyl ester carboxylesterase